MTLAFSGSQTLIQVRTSTSPDVYTTVGECTSFGPFGAQRGDIEATHLQSTAKEFISDLPDGSPITAICNDIPTDVAQLALVAAYTSGAALPCKYTYPVGGGSKYYTFDVLVKGWEIPTTAPNSVTLKQFNLKTTGAITGPT